MFKKIAFLSVLLLSACQMTDPAPAAGKLSTAADFAPLVGKTLRLNETDFAVMNADGTLSGMFSGADTRGTWQVKDGFWCRTLTAGPRGPSPEDCQVWERSGDTLTIRRNRGQGASFQYTIS
ncbi:hypothetical protein [Yoonia sp. SS1-5]|uniref:Dihydrodipicolinate reductase n=1 Tax=Yoonia rhodophyticola TaxID=3137370 RepID=A0AAN0MB25_9RHOB